VPVLVGRETRGRFVIDRHGESGVVTTAHAAQPRWSVPRQAGALLFSFALVALVSVAGASFTETGPGSWYEGLDKPPWNPPGWVFAPVWTVLYAMMAVAAWLVAREGTDQPRVRTALGLYGTQLLLNFAWTALFFGAQRPGLALVDILALLVGIVATAISFRPVSRLAALLLVPYAAWAAFAASLNAWIALAS
jgi:tryptophan-rich sensory protein